MAEFSQQGNKPNIDHVREAMMLDLGNDRMEDLARDDGRKPSLHITPRTFTNSSSTARVNNPAAQMYINALRAGKFDDEDAKGVERLDSIANGRLHAINREAGILSRGGRGGGGRGGHHGGPGRGGIVPHIHRMMQGITGYDPARSRGATQGRGRSQTRQVPNSGSVRMTSLGGLLPTGATVKRWESGQSVTRNTQVNGLPTPLTFSGFGKKPAQVQSSGSGIGNGPNGRGTTPSAPAPLATSNVSNLMPPHLRAVSQPNASAVPPYLRPKAVAPDASNTAPPRASPAAASGQNNAASALPPHFRPKPPTTASASQVPPHLRSFSSTSSSGLLPHEVAPSTAAGSASSVPPHLRGVSNPSSSCTSSPAANLPPHLRDSPNTSSLGVIPQKRPGSPSSPASNVASSVSPHLRVRSEHSTTSAQPQPQPQPQVNASSSKPSTPQSAIQSPSPSPSQSNGQASARPPNGGNGQPTPDLPTLHFIFQADIVSPHVLDDGAMVHLDGRTFLYELKYLGYRYVVWELRLDMGNVIREDVRRFLPSPRMGSQILLRRSDGSDKVDRTNFIRFDSMRVCQEFYKEAERQKERVANSTAPMYPTQNLKNQRPREIEFGTLAIYDQSEFSQSTTGNTSASAHAGNEAAPKAGTPGLSNEDEGNVQSEMLIDTVAPTPSPRPPSHVNDLEGLIYDSSSTSPDESSSTQGLYKYLRPDLSHGRDDSAAQNGPAPSERASRDSSNGDLPQTGRDIVSSQIMDSLSDEEGPGSSVEGHLDTSKASGLSNGIEEDALVDFDAQGRMLKTDKPVSAQQAMDAIMAEMSQSLVEPETRSKSPVQTSMPVSIQDAMNDVMEETSQPLIRIDAEEEDEYISTDHQPQEDDEHSHGEDGGNPVEDIEEINHQHFATVVEVSLWDFPLGLIRQIPPGVDLSQNAMRFLSKLGKANYRQMYWLACNLLMALTASGTYSLDHSAPEQAALQICLLHLLPAPSFKELSLQERQKSAAVVYSNMRQIQTKARITFTPERIISLRQNATSRPAVVDLLSELVEMGRRLHGANNLTESPFPHIHIPSSRMSQNSSRNSKGPSRFPHTPRNGSTTEAAGSDRELLNPRQPAGMTHSQLHPRSPSPLSLNTGLLEPGRLTPPPDEERESKGIMIKKESQSPEKENVSIKQEDTTAEQFIKQESLSPEQKYPVEQDAQTPRYTSTPADSAWVGAPSSSQNSDAARSDRTSGLPRMPSHLRGNGQSLGMSGLQGSRWA